MLASYKNFPGIPKPGFFSQCSEDSLYSYLNNDKNSTFALFPKIPGIHFTHYKMPFLKKKKK